MKKLIALIAIGFPVLLTGCATNGDVENLQLQIDGVKAQIAQTNSAVASLGQSIANAEANSQAAYAAAKRAETAAVTANEKLDRVFRHTQMK